MSSVSFPRPASAQVPDDSIDLQHERGRSHNFNWLAAVNPNASASPKKTATPTPSPSTVTQTTPMRTAHSAESWSLSPENLTAMGSPIPIETDDADGPAGKGFQSTEPRSHGSRGLGGSPAPQLTPPQPFQPVTTRPPAARAPGGTGHTPVYATQASCSSSQDGLPSPVAAVDATSPFAPSVHNSYSSAIMQALSMSEGAAIAEAALSAPQQSHARSGSGSASRPSDALYHDGMRAKLAKQQWATVEKARQELLEAAKVHRECSFTPTLSPYAAQVKRPAALRPENRAQAEVLRRKQWLAVKQQERIEQELEACTFRPLTLRAVNLEPLALQANAAVFDNLYEDAQEKQYFVDNVRARVVEEMETRVLYPQATSAVMPPEKIAEVVDRLFAKSAVVATTTATTPTTGADHDNLAHQPELAPRTLQIVESQEEAGERNPNVVDRLYSAQRAPTTQELIEKQLEAQRERTTRLVRKQELEDERLALALEHDRTLLRAKYRALSKHAAVSRGQLYKPDRPQSVVGLARASLDVLTAEEAEELLYILEKCTTECISDTEFIERVLKSARESPSSTRCALLRCPPPPTSHQELVRRTQSEGPASTALVPAPLPKARREKADPEALERAKERRERRMEEYREEKARRAANDPIDGDAPLDDNYTFQPAPRRLIPYECRPDVQIDVKPTRAFALRRASALGQPLPSASHPSTRGASASSAGSPSAARRSGGDAVINDDRHLAEASRRDTARLLCFTEDDAGPAGQSAQSHQKRRAAPAHRDKKSHPTTYADIAEVRERLSASHNATAATATTTTTVGAARGVIATSNDMTESARAQGGLHHAGATVVAGPPAPAPRSRSSSSARAVSPHVNPSASVAELAAAGGKPALRQLGRELLLKQLREFQASRRQRVGS